MSILILIVLTLSIFTIESYIGTKEYPRIEFIFDERLNRLDAVQANYNGTLYFAYGILPEYYLLGKRFGTRHPRADPIYKVKGYPETEWFADVEGGWFPNPTLYKALGVDGTPLNEYKVYTYEEQYLELQNADKATLKSEPIDR
ncbi:MAG: hypothetical protein LBL49_06605 [Clostridiales Family XIII bacterium]|nr:hypothetical protein [Clostridiales Family XIII bacterium]